MFHKPSFVEKEEGTKGSQRWFGRTRGLAIHVLVPSVLVFSVLDRWCCATCMGERSWISLHLVILRDLPHTYSCTCLYSKEKTKVKTRRDSTGFNTKESKIYWIKEQEVLEAPDFILLFAFYLFIYYILWMAMWIWWVT